MGGLDSAVFGGGGGGVKHPGLGGALFAVAEDHGKERAGRRGGEEEERRKEVWC